MKRARVLHADVVRTGTEHDQGVQLDDGRVMADSAVKWLPPVEPGTVFAVGLNYKGHAAESGMELPPIPAIFTKFPTSLTGPNVESFTFGVDVSKICPRLMLPMKPSELPFAHAAEAEAA